MSNRGQRNGDRRAPPQDPPLWRRVLSSAIAWAILVVMLAGFVGVTYWTWTRPNPDRDQTEQFDESDRFRAR